VPAMVIDFCDGDEPAITDKMYAVLPLDELVYLLKERPEVFASSRKDAKYETASIPSLLRKEE
jgi:hypothetical protein